MANEHIDLEMGLTVKDKNKLGVVERRCVYEICG